MKVKVKTGAVRDFFASHICPQSTRAYMGHGEFLFVRRLRTKSHMWATRHGEFLFVRRLRAKSHMWATRPAAAVGAG